jgi:chromodomain-containing protein
VFKKPKKTKRNVAKEGAEPRWLVKRLENMSTQNVDGKPVRYFLVRWEGDWPPGQNPTWEPEENINRELVRQFLRQFPRKRKRSSGLMNGTGDQVDPALDTSHVPLPSGPEHRYSSVADMFEGPEVEMQMAYHANGDDGVAVEDVEDEMFLVEEEPVKSQGVGSEVLSRESEIALQRAYGT